MVSASKNVISVSIFKLYQQFCGGLDLVLDIFPKIMQRFTDVRLKVFSSLKVYQVTEDRDEWEPLYRRCAETAGLE